MTNEEIISRASPSLKKKIEHSIELLKKAQKLAFLMQPEHGFWLAFSGGKDSQCILQLADMANVKYTAYYNVTTLDPPENVYFIRNNYPKVVFNHPKETFLQIIRRKHILPTRVARFCCEELKETGGVGYTCIVGVRANESVGRAKNGRELQIWATTKSKFDREKERGIDGVVEIGKMEQANFQCVGGKDKVNISPILTWTEFDVWEFIHICNLPINPLYKTRNRVGCMFCPYANKKDAMQDAERYPKFADNIKKEIQLMLDNGKFESVQQYNPTADEIFDWWHSGLAIKDYFQIKRTQTQMQFE